MEINRRINLEERVWKSVGWMHLYQKIFRGLLLWTMLWTPGFH